jgi:hypothetical protein
MRVINLDETGIKLLNNKKNQIYLNRDELTDFVNGNYAIVNNKLTFKNKTLSLSESEIKEFPTILSYLKTLMLYK